MDEKDLWQSVLNEIIPEVNSASFHAWFNDLKLIKIKDNKVYIQVPMEIHKRILTTNYYNLIDDAFYKITNHNYEFEFLLKEEITDELYDVKQIVDNVDNFNFDVKEEKKVPVIDELWESNLIPELNFDNYMVGDSNRLAKTAGMIVAEQPGKVHNPLFIYGKSGLGKTHLMHAIGNYIVNHSKKKVLYTTSEMFKDDYINIINNENKNSIQVAANFKKKYREVDVLIIDDIQYLVGAEKTQQEFFHTFNALHQANKQIIISSFLINSSNNLFSFLLKIGSKSFLLTNTFCSISMSSPQLLQYLACGFVNSAPHLGHDSDIISSPTISFILFILSVFF